MGKESPSLLQELRQWLLELVTLDKAQPPPGLWENVSSPTPIHLFFSSLFFLLPLPFSLLLVSQTLLALQTKQAAGCGHAKVQFLVSQEVTERIKMHRGKGGALMV